jgi:uncharacterized protein
MNVTHLTAARYVKQPWRNGGGTSTEIAAQYDGVRFLWRVSLADVERAGAFSDFSGYERTIMLVEGKGMVLTFDQAPEARIDRPRRPFVFAGEWKTDCRLIDDPVKDLNLMVDRARARGVLEVTELSGRTVSRALHGDTELLYCLEGPIRIEADGRMITLSRGETLRIDGGSGSTLSLESSAVDAALAAIRIEFLAREKEDE